VITVSDVAVWGKCAVDSEILWVLSADLYWGIGCELGHCVIQGGVKLPGPWDDTATEDELTAALTEEYTWP
jgi:hypothetical protein